MGLSGSCASSYLYERSVDNLPCMLQYNLHTFRVPGDQQQIFFHGSEVHDSDEDPDKQFVLQQLLQIGDEVSFDLKHIVHKEKKVNAINIRKLASGTIAAVQSAKMGRYRGIVKTTPGESSWRSAVSPHSCLCLPVCPSARLSVCLSVCPFVCLCLYTLPGESPEIPLLRRC